jgi:hypothetical protein
VTAFSPVGDRLVTPVVEGQSDSTPRLLGSARECLALAASSRILFTQDRRALPSGDY